MIFPYGLEVWHQCLAGFREIHSSPFSNTKSVFEDLNILCIILLIFFLFFCLSKAAYLDIDTTFYQRRNIFWNRQMLCWEVSKLFSFTSDREADSEI